MVLGVVLLLAHVAHTQQVAPKTYSDYYSESLKTYRRPPATAARYTYDKYFYQRPTLSPYLNLTRPSGGYTNNYYQFVQPEMQRRSAAGGGGGGMVSTALPSSGGLAMPTSTGTAYHNHWYSGRQNLGLNP